MKDDYISEDNLKSGLVNFGGNGFRHFGQKTPPEELPLKMEN